MQWNLASSSVGTYVFRNKGVFCKKDAGVNHSLSVVPGNHVHQLFKQLHKTRKHCSHPVPYLRPNHC